MRVIFISICLFLAACSPPGDHHPDDGGLNLTNHEAIHEEEPRREPPDTVHPQALCVLKEHICEKHHASYAESHNPLGFAFSVGKACKGILVHGQRACTFESENLISYLACRPITREDAPCSKASENECGKGDYELCTLE